MAATAKVRICCLGSFPLFLKIRSDILTLFPILVWKSCCVWKHDAIFSGKLPVRLLVLGKHKAHAPLLKRRSTGSLMGREGVEPSRCHHRRILSPLRLPIPPSPRHAIFYLILKCFPTVRHYPCSSCIYCANL